MSGYLDALDRLLAAGAAGLSPEFAARQVEFIAARQLPDGGFRGRQGGSDPYYTDFALRVLALLAPEHEAVGRAGGQSTDMKSVAPGLRPSVLADAGSASPSEGLSAQGSEQRISYPLGPAPTIVECFSRLNARRILRACGADKRREVGGRRCLPDASSLGNLFHLPHEAAGVGASQVTLDSAICSSLQRRPPRPYDAFLAALCLDCLGEESPLVAEAARAVADLQAPDGGFTALPGEGAAQTSLTAAAVGLMQMGECLEPEAGAAAARFLAALQAPDGALRAHPRAPAGDLLSTFTGLLTLFGLEGMDLLDTAGVARFVRGAASPGGGFSAGPGDGEPDVEYTYYGLGTICLLRVFALARQ